jgi:hypothetical protein
MRGSHCIIFLNKFNQVEPPKFAEPFPHTRRAPLGGLSQPSLVAKNLLKRWQQESYTPLDRLHLLAFIAAWAAAQN